MAARLLVNEGHQVLLHARNLKRVEEALSAVPGAEAGLSGDLSSISETKHVAYQVNELGLFDAVIHNAAVGSREQRRITTIDGLSHIFAINSLAPYILTCLIKKPKRLVYISSGLHQSGDSSMNDLNWNTRRWNGLNAYSDSKLQDVILAFAVARRWPDVLSNAMEPGWVATKMGGPGAPGNIEDGSKTQVWLAVSREKEAMVSGCYFYHKKLKNFNKTALDIDIQEKFISECERISGVAFPM
jgi:NAD(P)-dependent dehydrogenase (short-subunit alcohol dehydrogenase family)